MSAQRITAPRTALVTGAGRGIGRALAAGLVADGWSVALLGRTPEHLEETARLIEEVTAEAARDAADDARPSDDAPPVVVVQADVTDGAAVRAAVASAEERLGGIGLLVNCAGVIEEREVAFADDDVEDSWRVVEVNVRGPMLVTHAVLPGMLARGGGRVVNVNSGAAYRPGKAYTGYGISKGALARLTALVDAQYRDAGIRTFDLAPGVVRTDMTESMPLHDDRSSWTPVEASVELVLAIGAGDLDPLSGRFFRAGTDTVEDLVTHTYDILVSEARHLTLKPWGSSDPLGR